MNDEALRILPLAGDDVDELIRLACDIWRAHYPAMISRAQVEYMLAERYTPEKVRAELSRADSWWDKAMLDERMIGFVQYQLAEREEGTPAMKLAQIYVQQRCQRRGHGGQLLAHVEAEARKRGCRAIWLNVNRGNANSIAAYKKHGYAVAAHTVADIGGGFVMDDYVMERRL